MKLFLSRGIPFRKFIPPSIHSKSERRWLVLSLILLHSFGWSCGRSQAPNANSSTISKTKATNNGNTTADAPASGRSATLDIKEPERYSVAITISIQGSSDAPASMTTQQFAFAKLGADRRWAFTLPAPLGRIVYLEKSGLKYLILFDRKQYVELAADSLGFQMSGELTITGLVERLKTRALFEHLGAEPINGRTARKYRATSTQSDNQIGINGVIFIDEETGLPLDCELTTTAPGGQKSRVILEARDLQLSPDRSEFDVPAGLKKVSSQEAKQQIAGFASAIGYFAETLQPNQAKMKPPATANANSPTARESSRSRKR